MVIWARRRRFTRRRLSMKKGLVVAPHPDDETLGCGGTLLRCIEEGMELDWVIVTGMTEEEGFCLEQIEKRQVEIEIVRGKYGFSNVYQLNLPTSKLDTLPMSEIISAVVGAISESKPELIFTPFRNDAHSDHQFVFDAVMAASKPFRNPFAKKILAYETLSETEFGSKPESCGFKPNVFVDINSYLEKKLNILEIFESEIGEFPFPRSRKSVESLAYIRGAQANKYAAEAFMLVKEII